MTTIEKDGKLVLRCDMRVGCEGEVTHIDQSGFAYCTSHGLERRESEPCRKLQPWEVRRLQSGKTLARY